MALDFASLRRRSWNLKLPVIPLPDLPNRTYDDIQFVIATRTNNHHKIAFRNGQSNEQEKEQIPVKQQGDQ